MHESRFGDEDERLMHLVPAPAVILLKRRVLSRPGAKSLSPCRACLVFDWPLFLFLFTTQCQPHDGTEDKRQEEGTVPSWSLQCYRNSSLIVFSFLFLSQTRDPRCDSSAMHWRSFRTVLLSLTDRQSQDAEDNTVVKERKCYAKWMEHWRVKTWRRMDSCSWRAVFCLPLFPFCKVNVFLSLKLWSVLEHLSFHSLFFFWKVLWEGQASTSLRHD